jgi:hypothetical protein
MPIGKVFALYDYHSLLIDFEEPVRTQGAGLFEAKTKDALLSYSVVEERADYFTFKLKNLTFGEYSDQILYVAPLITGRVEFSIHRVSFTYDFVENKTKIKYKIMF